MRPFDYARQHLTAFLDEVQHLSTCDFPYPECGEAVERLRQHFSRVLEAHDKIDPAKSLQEAVRKACVDAIDNVYEYLPVLGFLHRSKDVRNPFEVFGPLLRIAVSILEPKPEWKHRKTKLIISSQWRYSPFISLQYGCLRDFLLIGLPAHMPDNPLLLPVTGHELGHALWDQLPLRGNYWKRIRNETKRMLRRDHWKREFDKLFRELAGVPVNQLPYQEVLGRSGLWALGQVEETFSDFVALRIFGESYLYTFAYLFSPGLAGYRPPEYPNMRRRARNLETACGEYDVVCEAGYGDTFEDMEELPFDRRNEFLLRFADSMLEELVPILIKDVLQLNQLKRVSMFSGEQKGKVIKDFLDGVPVVDSASLADILNAAWSISENPSLLEKVAHGRLRAKVDRHEVLKNLVLKAIEVLEFQQVLGAKR